QERCSRHNGNPVRQMQQRSRRSQESNQQSLHKSSVSNGEITCQTSSSWKNQSLASASSRPRLWSRSSKSVLASPQQRQLQQPRQQAVVRQQRLRLKRRPNLPLS